MTHVVNIPHPQTVDAGFADHRHRAKHRRPLTAVVEGVGQQFITARAVGQQGHHAALIVIRRLEANHRRHRPGRGNVGAGIGRAGLIVGINARQVIVAHRHFHPAFGRLDQQVDFGVVLEGRRDRADQQQIRVFVLDLVAIVGHLQINRRQTGLRTDAPQRLQQRRHLALGRRLRHHHQRVGKVRHTAVREARIGEDAQVRQGDKVIILREVDGRIVANHHMVLHRLEGNTVVDGAAGHRVHILEVKAQLVDRPKTQRGDGDLRFAVQQPLQHRQAQDQFVHVLGAVKAERLQKLVVEADIHPRAVLHRRHGVAVFQIHIDAVGPQQIEIRRQVKRHGDGIRHQAAGLQLLLIGFQLSKGDRTVGAHPVRRVVRLTRLQGFDAVHGDAAAAEQNIALSNPLRRQQQVVIIAAENHQQLDVGIVRVVDHFDGRRLDRRMIAQEVRTLVVGGEDNGVTIRQFIEIDRELLAAPAGLAAEPGGDYRRRLLLGDRWRARENHRQLQRTVIARIVERHREV